MCVPGRRDIELYCTEEVRHRSDTSQVQRRAASACVQAVVGSEGAYMQVGELNSASWGLFQLITSVYFGKEYYSLTKAGLVYSRLSHSYLTYDEALDEFLKCIGDQDV